MKFLEEFKDFILKGNALDMALGIIIGTAFNKVVSSLVSDIIMPPIGLVLGGVNFPDLKIVLKHKVLDKAGHIAQSEVSINYGKFFQVLIDFTIVAFTVFLIINLINKLMNKKKKDFSWQENINK